MQGATQLKEEAAQGDVQVAALETASDSTTSSAGRIETNQQVQSKMVAVTVTGVRAVSKNRKISRGKGISRVGWFGKVGRYPAVRSICKVAALGLSYGSLACCFCNVSEKSQMLLLTEAAMSKLTFAAYLLFPAPLAFVLGWKHRHWTRGAGFGFVLGAAIVAGTLLNAMVTPTALFLSGSGILPNSLLGGILDGLFESPSKITLAWLVLVGALGGGCSKVAQALAGRSQKNNR